MEDLVPIRRALISVSDKTDLIPLAKKLAAHGVQIISTGGTARKIREAGVDVTPVDQVTDFPEMMDGRVKTLHPRIHGGLLALRDNAEHVASMNDHGIEPIDLVCVNLYPFESTIAKEGVSEAEAIEQIDIGGPSMVRSAAKNHQFVTIVTDPTQYDTLCGELDQHDGATTLGLRRRLAAAAFARTSSYDTTIAMWMSERFGGSSPDTLTLQFEKHPLDLKYGENPHQSAALYIDRRSDEASVARARIVHGGAPGFCNYFDADGALELVKEIDADRHAAVAIIKHANPCGFAVADDLPTAFTKAYAGDPLAAFGGIVALNRTVDLATAEAIGEGKKLLHLILAPAYDRDALDLLAKRWKDVRILETGPLPKPADRSKAEMALRQVTGGLLVHDRDLAPFDHPEAWEHKAGPAPDTGGRGRECPNR